MKSPSFNFSLDSGIPGTMVSKIGDTNIISHPCFCFIEISILLWAEPIIAKFFGNKYLMKLICRLKAGI